MDTTRTVPTRKRRRPPKACEQCRKRKVRCDQNSPCNQCIRMKFGDCTYDPQTLIKRSKSSVVSPASGTGFAGAPPTPVSTDGSQSTFHRKDEVPHVTTATRAQSPSNFDPSQSNISGRPPPRYDSSELLEDTFFHVGIETNVNAVITKTRVLGKSHWINVVQEFTFIHKLKKHIEAGHDQDTIRLLDECKILGRKIKSQTYAQLKTCTNLRDQIPGQNVADELVDNYFRAYESYYRILHVPSFRKEYAQFWKKPSGASSIFVVKLLLVLAIGASLSSDISTHQLRASVLEWVNSAQLWIFDPFTEKAKLSVSGVQVFCLLLLARETNAISPDLTWISVGSLVRMAMLIGLHRDPSLFPRVSMFQAEVRRRLWATIMEMCIQSSMNSGGAPMVSPDTHDCRAPSNLDDTDINEETGTISHPKADDIFTQSSVQIALLKTATIRLKIATSLNDFRFDQSFAEILQVSSKFSESLHSASRCLKTSCANKDSISTNTSLKMYDLMTNRFFVGLHQSFALRALKDPSYYFSRKVCVDTALLIASLMFPSSNRASNNDFERILRATSGTTKDSYSSALMLLFIELATQLENVHATPANIQDELLRQEILRVAEAYLTFCQDRMRFGETSVKGFCFVACGLAYIKAKASGASNETASLDTALKAGKKACAEGVQILQQRLEKMDPSSSVATRLSTGPTESSIELLFDDFQWDDWEPGFEFGLGDLLFPPLETDL